MSADRGAFICQSQSLNIHMQDPNFGKLTSMHFHAWKKGLKTGMYYLRTKAAKDATKFTVSAEMVKPKLEPKAKEDDGLTDHERELAAMQCSLDNPDECLACGS